MKILITGASGYVGSKIYKDLKEQGFDVAGTYYNTKLFDELIKVDLTNKSEVKTLIKKVSPDIIVHTAADAHTSTCEKNPEYARKINVDSTKYLCDGAQTIGARFIHISTFACFNENPTKMYPKTKLEAENHVKKLANYVILRLSLVVGLSPNTSSKNFYNDLVKAYKSNSVFEADSSWEFEMSYLANVSKVIKQIIENEEINKVMIPYVEKGVTSRYKIAKDVAATKRFEVKRLVSDRIIPLPKLDISVFEKYGIERGHYDHAISLMQKELEQ